MQRPDPPARTEMGLKTGPIQLRRDSEDRGGARGAGLKSQGVGEVLVSPQ